MKNTPTIVYRVQTYWETDGEWRNIPRGGNSYGTPFETDDIETARTRMSNLSTHSPNRIVKVTITETEEVVA